MIDGTDADREAVKWYAEQILKLDEQLADIVSVLYKKCRENILCRKHTGN
ncbi:hypothetical protein [Blautia wexlerae]|nr:hypothetical protein [Blautia wexlerae]NSF38022.1 hypothetical protein [Blautia wexlerae]NSF55104.1 hypothetical protein [Blautia wexlerae]